MKGLLTDPAKKNGQAQRQFIADLRQNGIITDTTQVIAMTHHTGMDYAGLSKESGLWDDMAHALASNGQAQAPDYWYWGHIHNGIAYSNSSPAGQSGCKARCVGHGAIPFGVAWGIKEFTTDGQVSYYPDKEIGGTNRVRNGFAMITLNGTDISEAFYEVDPNSGVKEVWSNP